MTTETTTSAAANSLSRRFKSRDIHLGLLALLIWVAASWWAADAAMHSQQRTMFATASVEVERSADNLAALLSSSMERLHGIPMLASGSPMVLDAFTRRFGDADALTLQQRQAQWLRDPALLILDHRLQDLLKAMNVDLLWLINGAGNCVAANNFDQAESMIGVNYADRDYFKQAMAGHLGFQYAVGRTTHVQGLFFSAPIVIAGEVRGVAVAKIDLSRLEAFLRQTDSFLTDAYGVIILATDPARTFQTLSDSTVGRLSVEQREARYKRSEFAPLPISAAGEPGFPALVRIGEHPDPALLAHRPLVNGAIGLHLVHRLGGHAALRVQRLSLFLALSASGAVVIILIAMAVGALRYRRATMRDMAHSLSLLRATLDATEDGILVVDTHGRTTIFNQRFVDIWRLPAALLESRDDAAMLDFVHGQLVEPERFLKQVIELYGHPDKTSHDVLHFLDGRVIDRFSFPQRLGAEVCGRVWAFRDVTQRERNEQQIRELAFYDALTALPNRRLLFDRITQVMSVSEREGMCAAVLYLDLDRFKWLNDKLGHDAGDQLLREVALRLRACVRDSDTVARLGGDEFVVLLAHLSADREAALSQAQGVARKIKLALGRPMALHLDKGEAVNDYVASTSIGVCVFKGKELSIDEVLRRSDAEMYAVKSASRSHTDEAESDKVVAVPGFGV